MTRYSVTGVSRALTPAEIEIMRSVVRGLTDVTEFTTGCATGVDTAAHMIAIIELPNIYHRLCVPAAPHNQSIVHDERNARVIVEYVPAGMSRGESYMLRNDRLVAHADILLAFPETRVEELRSGTWATIRRARRAGIGIDVHPLRDPAPISRLIKRPRRRQRSSPGSGLPPQYPEAG
jgi:predicted Rossmann fold nucleotide-binding protein DprA/Smf involved in DNA uptake